MHMQQQSQRPKLPSNGFVRLAQLVPEIVPVSPATLWRMVATGEFPSPIRLSKRIAAWRMADVDQWIESRTPGVANDAQ